MELNKVHHLNFLDNTLPDKCANLIIADPPYFETKGDFDFIWKTFEDYLKDVEKWAIECKRILTDNGSLLWFGASKNIAYTQIIIDKHLKLINNLVWEKAEADGLFGSTGSKQLRSFPNSTERILYYSNEWDISSGNIISDKATIKSRDYIRSEIIKAKGKIKLNEINLILGTASNGGGVASSVLSDKKLENTFITKEHYNILRQWLNKDSGDYLREEYDYLREEYDYLREEYEDLREEYEDLRRPFDNISKSTEVLKVRFTPSEHDHDTVKPELLARLLINTCSRPHDLIVIPFAGSGTECSMSKKEGRNFWACDIEKKYVDMSNKRCMLQHKDLF